MKQRNTVDRRHIRPCTTSRPAIQFHRPRNARLLAGAVIYHACARVRPRGMLLRTKLQVLWRRARKRARHRPAHHQALFSTERRVLRTAVQFCVPGTHCGTTTTRKVVSAWVPLACSLGSLLGSLALWTATDSTRTTPVHALLCKRAHQRYRRALSHVYVKG